MRIVDSRTTFTALAPTSETCVRPARLAIAFLLALVGVVWVGQGLGLIGGSFMTGSPAWAVIGVVLLALAVVVVLVERRRSA